MEGIKIKIDEKSVDNAKKSFTKATKKSGGLATGAIGGGMVVGGEELLEGGKDTEKKTKKSNKQLAGMIGKAIPIAALIALVKPIQQILQVIGAIISVGLAPLLPIIRMALLGLLAFVQKIAKLFGVGGTKTKTEEGKAGEQEAFEARPVQEQIEGTAGDVVSKMKSGFRGLIDKLFNPDNFTSLFGKHFATVAELFGSGFGNQIFGFLDIIGGVIDVIVGIFTLDMDLIGQGIKNIFGGMWDILVGIGKMFAGFFGMIGVVLGHLWLHLKKAFNSIIEYIVDSFEEIKEIGIWLWDTLTDIFSSAFDVLKGIGSWIWDEVTSFFGGGDGGSTSHEDVLITNTGEVHDFNPNDNIMAFQGDIPTSGNTYNIKVEGFVGDEDLLAEKLSKTLNELNRGVNF